MDITSDEENADIMLGSSSRDDPRDNNSENVVNLDSGSRRPQQNSNLVGEDFRSLLIANSRENSGITIETTRMISDEITNQLSKKLGSNLA